MTPNRLRQLWSLVESSHSSQIHELDDRGLVNWLVFHMSDQASNSEQSAQETHALERYIRDHLLLIRDVAGDTWMDDPVRSAMASC